MIKPAHQGGLQQVEIKKIDSRSEEISVSVDAMSRK